MKTKRHFEDLLNLRIVLLTGIAAAMLVVSLPADAVAQQETEESVGFAVASGRITFRRYCASCHGPEGLGDGNVAQYLAVPPSDVTQMRMKYDGEFPIDRVSAIIDGTEAVRGHGTSEMPVWGEVFESSLAEPQMPHEEGEQRAAMIVRQLVFYIRSIQSEEGGGSDGVTPDPD